MRSARFTSPRLPDFHRAPFDRMLVRQAIAHALTVLIHDGTVRRDP
jgi:PIN domain nuclease of toxin-antitoxin system